MRSVLLVDDERDLTEACRLSLSLAGHEVTVANDGLEAVKILTTTPLDLVITDLRMPQLDGFTLLRWIVSHKPSTKVIVMTAFGSPVVTNTAKRLGALHCLNKPVSREALLETVANVLGESGPSGQAPRVTVADYVRLCMQTGKTSTFEVSSGRHQGTIAIVEGIVTHAEQGDQTGEPAFCEILSWEGSQLSEKDPSLPLTPNLTTGGYALLLKALRLRDEARPPRPPEAAAPAGETPPPPAAPAPSEPAPGPGPPPPPEQDTVDAGAETPPPRAAPVSPEALPDSGAPRMTDRAPEPAEPPAAEAPSTGAAVPSALDVLAEMLSQDPHVTEYGIFVEQDFLRYKRSVTGAILQATPSLCLKLGDSLKEAWRCGALRYLLVHTQAGARYMVFDYLNARGVVGLRPGARPDVFWENLRRR
jgi:DNA-binding response OmpR family regulator